MGDIQVISLPASRWREARQIRLEALRDSPQAFAVPYDHEAAHPDEFWIGRLREAEDGRAYAIYAEHDGKLVGMIGAFFEAGPEVATIVAMYVSPSYRGRGVGRQLVEAIIERLGRHPGTEKATLMVNVEQLAAVELYRSAGFEVVEKQRIALGDGRVYDELIMERSLR